MGPSAASTLPRMPVSSATRDGGLLGGLAQSRCAPLGSDHTGRFVDAADQSRDLRVSWTVDTVNDQPSADVSCTVRIRVDPRRGERDRGSLRHSWVGVALPAGYVHVIRP